MSANIGLHADRLAKDRDNPREVAFVRQWHHEHDGNDLLSELLRVSCDRNDPERQGGILGDPLGYFYKYPLGKTTERDRIVAETVIQWLGSNVGLDFVRCSLRKCGYALTKQNESPQ